MSGLEIALRCVGGVFLIAANGLFVVSEFALTRLRQFPEERAVEVGGELGWKMTEELEVYLTACQLGISVMSVTLGVVVEPAVTAAIEPLASLVGLEGGAARAVSFAIALVGINLIHKIWGEQAPTYLGVERPLAVARYTSPILYGWTRATYPAVIAGDRLAKWTLRLIGVEMSRSWTEAQAPPDSDAEREPAAPATREHLIETLTRLRLPPDRREEILATYDIGERAVSEIMTPLEQIISLDAERPWSENAEVLARAGKTRLPLVRGSSEPIGVIYVPALFGRLDELEGDPGKLEEIAVSPVWIEHDLDIASALDRLQDEDNEIGMVSDEDGALIGLVTITDALEAIAGDLRDPIDSGGHLAAS